MSNMKFNTIDELSYWLHENKATISDLNISLPVMTSGYAHVEGDEIPNTSTTITTSHPATGDTEWINVDAGAVCETIVAPITHEIAIKSLSVQPNIRQVSVNESEYNSNIWYVDSYESVEDACSTSKIEYKGSTMLMNVCESGGESKVSLVVEVDGNIARIEFKLEESCNNTSEYDMILAI